MKKMSTTARLAAWRTALLRHAAWSVSWARKLYDWAHEEDARAERFASSDYLQETYKSDARAHRAEASAMLRTIGETLEDCGLIDDAPIELRMWMAWHREEMRRITQDGKAA